MKKIVLAFLVGALVTIGFTSLASVLETISVSRNTINLEVNGKKINEDNFIYEGRTYVQMRAIGEMLGKKVEWNANTKTASIVDGDVTDISSLPTTKATPKISVGHDRLNPANIGETLNVKVENYSDKYEADIKLVEIIRGQKAWSMIKEANQFNAEAKEGYEYILAKVKFKLVSYDKRLSLSSYDFTSVSGKGKDYEHVSVSSLKPSIDTDLYEGAEHEGYIAFQVEKNDLKPIITYGRDYEGQGGIWFKAYYEGGTSTSNIQTSNNSHIFYTKHPGVPDFGAILNVPIDSATATTYTYNLDGIESSNIKKYIGILEEEGFAPDSIGKTMIVHKKGEQTVTLMFTDSFLFLDIK